MVDRLKFAVTAAQIGVAREKLVEAGFNLAEETGVLQKDSYRIGYAVAEGVLLLGLLTKPRPVPMMAVKARIRSVLAHERIRESGDGVVPVTGLSSLNCVLRDPWKPE